MTNNNNQKRDLSEGIRKGKVLANFHSLPIPNLVNRRVGNLMTLKAVLLPKLRNSSSELVVVKRKFYKRIKEII